MDAAFTVDSVTIHPPCFGLVVGPLLPWLSVFHMAGKLLLAELLLLAGLLSYLQKSVTLCQNKFWVRDRL